VNRDAGPLDRRAARSFVVLWAGCQTVDDRRKSPAIHADDELFEASLRSAHVKIGDAQG